MGGWGGGRKNEEKRKQRKKEIGDGGDRQSKKPTRKDNERKTKAKTDNNKCSLSLRQHRYFSLYPHVLLSQLKLKKEIKKMNGITNI